MNSCLACDRIQQIRSGTNPYFVKELVSSFAVLFDFQEYEGYVLLLHKRHIADLHELSRKEQVQFFMDASDIGTALKKAFTIEKINYELLGNSVKEHVHWHIIPRRKTDKGPQGPIWLRGKDQIYAESAKPSREKLQMLKLMILQATK